MKQEVINYWIEKAKYEVREEERKKKIEEKFKEEFGFEAEEIYFVKSRYFACTKIKLQKEIYIEGNKIESVEFVTREKFNDELDDEEDKEYQFTRYKHNYLFFKRGKDFVFIVQINIEE